MAVIDLRGEGNITKQKCDQLGLNGWAIKMTADSFLKAPYSTKFRGIKMLVNDYSVMLQLNTISLEGVRDVRQLGNLTLEEIEYFEINPVALVMIVKSVMKAAPRVKANGVLFLSHNIIFEIKPETNSKFLLLTKEDRSKLRAKMKEKKR